MIKKVEIHIDALITIILVFAISLGFNLYQKNQSSELFQKYMDMQWKAQTMEVNWKYVKSKLENCNK